MQKGKPTALPGREPMFDTYGSRPWFVFFPSLRKSQPHTEEAFADLAKYGELRWQGLKPTFILQHLRPG